MALCPPTNKPDADLVYTPDSLARAIVEYFAPNGRCLEPCRGGGAFERAMPGCDWCEIAEGRDFLQWTGEYDWVITNPPWSKIMPFLAHCITLSVPNIVFLVNLNALTTKARLREIYHRGYHIAEIIAVDTPRSFPQMGFQLTAVKLEKGPAKPFLLSFKTWK